MSSKPEEGSQQSPWTGEAKQKFTTYATHNTDDDRRGGEADERKPARKSKSEFYDPCQEAAQRSYKCLYRNNGDKTMCTDYFQAYRDCKQAWTEKRRKDSGSFW